LIIYKYPEPDLTKLRLTVQYVDKEHGVVVASDENYEQHEFPVKLISGAEGLLEPGTQVGLTKDGETPLKVALPTQILTAIKKQ
jgi:translation elongation factor P/translation initiation factor 5A